MNKKPTTREDQDNGFAEWGGYMAAKKAKLAEQYTEIANDCSKKLSDIFSGVAIFVNGYTNPSADELKYLMAAHGGTYHHYEMPNTTHIVASNLPNVKIKQLESVPIVKASWITDSIAGNKLLDYRKYLLYSNQNRKQPVLEFPVIPKPPLAADTKPRPHNSKTLTATHPQFLSEFYNNSRLHLISSLSVEYKQLVSRLREKSAGIFPGREKLKVLRKNDELISETDDGPTIMHIDMDCFFVSVGLRQNPELRGQPVAVTHAKGSQHSTSRSGVNLEQEYSALKKYFPNEQFDKIDTHASMSEVASCSYEARGHGVRNGMFLGTALKLCPQLKTIPYNFQGYREVSTTLYETVADYTLDIEAVSCDEMYVDVGPMLRDANVSVDRWAVHIRNEIWDRTGCPCSTGFGANRLQARLATKRAKPAGHFHLQQHQVEEHMAELPISDLPGVGHATLAKLKALGLSTCRDVQMTALSALQAELGQKAGEVLSKQARGIDHKPLNFQHQRKSISAEVNYGIRFKDKAESWNFLNDLSVEVHRRLQEVGMRAHCLTLKLLVRAPEAPQETAKFLGCGVCNAINRSTTGGSISDAATIYREAKTLLERVNVPPHELRGLGIQLTRLERVRAGENTGLTRFLQPRKDTVNVETIKKSPDAELKARVGLNCGETKHKSKTNIPKSPVRPADNRCSRSKGSNGTDKSSKSTNSLNKYFGLPTTKTRADTSTALEIDVDVLNELPEHLREEIIREYALNDVQLLRRTEKQGDDETGTADGEQQWKRSEFNRFNWEELKGIIISWLHSDREPSDVDVTMIGNYFKELAIDRKIEDLRKMCNFLYRHVEKKEHCSWHTAYLSVVNVLQEGMIARYGNTLLVERKFPRCINCVQKY